MKHLHVLYARAHPAVCKGKGGGGPDPPRIFKIYTNTYKMYLKRIGPLEFLC